MSEPLVKESISEEMVLKMIEAARKKAKEIGKAFVIAIVNEEGVLKGFLRMDNAPLISVQVAIDKAYTAAHQWYELIKNDPPLALGAPSGIQRLIVFGGGYPIIYKGKVIGGIGVSGGHYTEDMEVAKAALDALKL